VCIDNITSDEIYRAIEKIVTDKYYRNITYGIRKKFCWESQESRFLTIFKETSSYD